MKKILLFYILLFISLVLYAEDPIVSIYDEFDDGLFGKSTHRGVIVSVKKAAFQRAETLEVDNDGEPGFLTAVVMLSETAEKLENGYYELESQDISAETVYRFMNDGLDFSFSVEKANDKIISMVDAYYLGDEIWHDELLDYYRSNYVIRIYSAENIFESWTEEITYNEAMVSATLIGDEDQWLWGIHNGSDILNKGY